MKKFNFLMKTKNLILLASMFTTAISFASTIDISQADKIVCASTANGGFSLLHLNSDSKIVFPSRNSFDITVTEKKEKEISYSYTKDESRRFKLVFNKIQQHLDGSNHPYQTLIGFRQEGDLKSPIECTID